AWHLSLAESVFGSTGVFSRTSGLVYSRSHIYDFKCLLSTGNYRKKPAEIKLNKSYDKQIRFYYFDCAVNVGGVMRQQQERTRKVSEV
ncbi:MAG: hypothetical protein LBL07_17945, partial [Tannerella sp.]|nr:hypothetical protein [Tannerella sp.]